MQSEFQNKMPNSMQITDGFSTGGDASGTEASGIGTPVKHRISRLVFPLLVNTWPVLLFVSQKAVVPIGCLVVGAGDKAYRNDFFIVVVLALYSALILVVQPENDFQFQHYTGFVAFLLSVPLINLAVRREREYLLRWLAIFSVGNAILAFVFYVLNVDLSTFRGLNLIIDNTGEASRVYFESTSLIAVFSVSVFKKRWAKFISLILVLAYAIFLAKSIFVLALYLLNLLAPLIVRGKLLYKVIGVLVLSSAIALGPLIVSFLRADILLSLGVKLIQFNTIMGDSSAFFFGHGWGYAKDSIVNNAEQPYQVEMQLPMLVQQTGIVQVAIFALVIWYLIRRVSESNISASCRWGIYLLIGFNNPWLFLPSWYLTTALLFNNSKSKV